VTWLFGFSHRIGVTQLDEGRDGSPPVELFADRNRNIGRAPRLCLTPCCREHLVGALTGVDAITVGREPRNTKVKIERRRVRGNSDVERKVEVINVVDDVSERLRELAVRVGRNLQEAVRASKTSWIARLARGEAVRCMKKEVDRLVGERFTILVPDSAFDDHVHRAAPRSIREHEKKRESGDGRDGQEEFSAPGTRGFLRAGTCEDFTARFNVGFGRSIGIHDSSITCGTGSKKPASGSLFRNEPESRGSDKVCQSRSDKLWDVTVLVTARSYAPRMNDRPDSTDARGRNATILGFAIFLVFAELRYFLYESVPVTTFFDWFLRDTSRFSCLLVVTSATAYGSIAPGGSHPLSACGSAFLLLAYVVSGESDLSGAEPRSPSRVRCPLARVEQIWLSREIEPVSVRVVRIEGSDHRTVAADLSFRETC
jgi:hypothetical protein